MANCRQEDCHFCGLEGFCSLVNSLELSLERRKTEERELTFFGVYFLVVVVGFVLFCFFLVYVLCWTLEQCLS